MIKKSILILFSICIANNVFGFSTLPKAPYVLSQDVKKWKEEKKEFTLIDVREPSEFKAGHIDGAINIPYLKSERAIKRLNKNKKYITYCTYSAWRAPYVANMMLDNGFKDVLILEGGISAWNAGGQVIYASFPNEPGKVIPYPADMKHELNHRAAEAQSPRNFTRDELAKYNGQDGQPAYVAVSGIIYDLTESRLWRGGVHDPSRGKAMAGRDLTELLKESPHGNKHLKDFPIVGHLID